MFGIGGERDLTERDSPICPAGGTPFLCVSATAHGASASSTCTGSSSARSTVSATTSSTSRPIRWGPRPRPEKWGSPHDLAPATKRFLVDLADAAARRWQEKDHGIWEVRGEARHFVYSKLMCWVALDRAVALAEPLDASDRVPAWTGTRDQIRAAIMSEGWSERANAFTQAFGSDDLDASNLMLPLVGFLPPDDPKVLATIDATEAHLTDKRGLVYRYRAHDGLDGEEGTFLLCTFWLAQALAVAGQRDRARRVFERAAAFVNDVGLLSEEVDPVSGELLGNFPQAFSHIGLVNAAWAISEAEAAPRA